MLLAEMKYEGTPAIFLYWTVLGICHFKKGGDGIKSLKINVTRIKFVNV
jgi:hypothetical protein